MVSGLPSCQLVRAVILTRFWAKTLRPHQIAAPSLPVPPVRSTHVTETAYRHVIVPEIRGGATVMDDVFGDD